MTTTNRLEKKPVVKTPYKKMREVAQENAKLKKTQGAVQVRTGLTLVGLLIAMVVYYLSPARTNINPGKAF